MLIGNVTIAFFAGLGAAIWIYRKTSYKGYGDFKKQAAPAAISGALVFLVALTILWTFFS